MTELTDRQKLNITKLGRGSTLGDLSEKVFLSKSHVYRMCQGSRKVPDQLSGILDFDEGIKWYQTIISALARDDFSEADAADALQTLNKIVGVMRR